MSTSLIRPKPSRSVAVKAKLDYPVIDTFKDFVFGNPYRFYHEANPRFFEGTQVESKLRSSGVPQPTTARDAAVAAE